MGKDPDTIRRDIEQTRDRMGETVDAVGYKADVPARTKEKVSDSVGAVKEKIGIVGSKAGDATPSGQEVKQQAKRAAGVAQENPLGLAIGSIAVGFVAGMLIPSTRVEHEKLGPLSDRVTEQARETGQEALERGKQVVQDAAESARETAQESAQEHGEKLQSSAQDNLQTARSSS
jgi:ElaB/YqjD/DUF883 family membrane-anchored ribosome-binding protein